MKKIIAEIAIDRVGEWSADWENYLELRKELEQLKYDIKTAISKHCGIEYNDIEIKLHLSNE